MKIRNTIFIILFLFCFSVAYADQNDYSNGKLDGYNAGINAGRIKGGETLKYLQASTNTNSWLSTSSPSPTQNQSQTSESNSWLSRGSPSQSPTQNQSQATESSGWLGTGSSNQGQMNIPEPSNMPNRSLQYQKGYKDGWNEGYIKGHKKGEEGGDEGYILGLLLGVFGVLLSYIM